MTDWAASVLETTWARIDHIEAAAADRFPLYADPDGRWTTSARGSWTGGYWAGLLALRSAATGAPFPGAVRDRLDGWLGADTVCRGMVFWFGAAAERLGHTPVRGSTAAAADALAADFDPALSAVPWGSALAPEGQPVRPDGAVGVVPLLLEHGHRERAAAHLRTHLRLGVPAWPRGAAWLLSAGIDGRRRLDDDLDGALDPLLAPWNDPPADASACAIAGAALVGSGEPALRVVGERLLLAATTATSHYAGRDDLRVVWGEFFLALGAGVLTGLVAPDQW